MLEVAISLVLSTTTLSPTSRAQLWLLLSVTVRSIDVESFNLKWFRPLNNCAHLNGWLVMLNRFSMEIVFFVDYFEVSVWIYRLRFSEIALLFDLRHIFHHPWSLGRSEITKHGTSVEVQLIHVLNGKPKGFPDRFLGQLGFRRYLQLLLEFNQLRFLSCTSRN